MNKKLLLGEDRQTMIRRIAVVFIILSFVAFFRVAMIYRGDLRGQLFFWDKIDTFMDYFNCLPTVALKDPYENNCMYPPLSELIFFIFSKIIPYDTLFEHSPRELRLYQAPLLSLVLYLAVPIAITVWALADYLKQHSWKRFVIIAFLVSSPFMYTVERGNVLIYSFAAALVFICYYDSDKKWQREIALIALAVSAGIKLYPAALGLILIRDKRWREAIRCAIYGAIAVFAPFFFFGGFRSFMIMIESLQGNSGGFGPTVFNCKLNYAGIFDTIGVMWFGRTQSFSWGQNAAYVLAFLLVLSAFFTRKRWKAVLFLTLIMIGAPAFSFYYTGIFLLVPFLMYIAGEEKEMNWRDLLYFPAFIAFLAPIPIVTEPLEAISDININIQICSVCILFLTFWGIADSIIDLASRIRAKGASKGTEVKA